MAPEEPGPAPLMKERPNHWERVGVCHAVSVSNRVKAADLNATGGREVALEELHIVHEGLSRETP